MSSITQDFEVVESPPTLYIAWDLESGAVYDTCVQAWYVYESLHGAPVMDGAILWIMVVILLVISVFAIRRRMM